MSNRQQMAESFLQEAVFASRGAQATRHALASSPEGGSEGAEGQCGLGERAAVVLDLSDRGRELFEALFAGAAEDAQAEHTQAAADEERLLRMQQVMRQWITRQDALDRKRNHFLKDFRRAHGFDRNAYSEELAAEFERGLERINGENRERLASAARELLAL